MTFFVDANVFVYAATPGEYQEPCAAVLRAIAGGVAAGQTSTAALEEVWQVETRMHGQGIDGLTARAHLLMGPLLAVTDEVFGRALALDAPEMGTNDRIHAATCLQNGIETIVSADTDFDRLDDLQRVDPLDREALAGLLDS